MSENNNYVNSNEEIKNNKTPDEEKKAKSSLWKYIFNISVVLIVTVVAIVITVKDDFNKIMDYIFSCDYKWLLVVFGLMFAAILIRSFILFVFARLFTRKYSYPQAMAVDCVGTFYSAVTPGASGGQVMQAYTYKKQGIPISSAVSALAMLSIMFQIVLILYCTVSLIVKYDVISTLGNVHIGAIGDWDIILPTWALTLVGYLLNVGVIGIVLMMGYWKGFHNFILGPCIGLLHKMHLCKNPEKTRESLRIQVENFKIEMRRLFSNVPFTILVAVLFVLYITVRYSIPYFVGVAMGNESQSATFWDSVFLSNYHQMITGLIPIPGSAGISEGVFVLLFSSSDATAQTSFFFKEAGADLISQFAVKINNGEIARFIELKDLGVTNPEVLSAAKILANTSASSTLAKAALLVWRSITFIIPLAISGLVTAFYRASPKEEVTNRGYIPNRETFVDLQGETYAERYEETMAMIETRRLTRDAIKERLKTLNKKTAKKKTKESYHSVEIKKDDEDK